MTKEMNTVIEELGKTAQQLALCSSQLSKAVQTLLKAEAPADEAAEKPAAKAETKAKAEPVTHEDVLKVLAEYAAMDKAAAKKLLNDYGAKKLKLLDPSKYADIIRDANEAMKELKKKEADKDAG